MNFLYRFRGVVLGLFAVALCFFPHRTTWIPASAGLLALAGIIVRIEARRVIGEHTRGGKMSAPELVTWGIYSHLRHPLYLSNLCLCYSFILFHLGWQKATYIFAAAITLFIFSLAKAEDSFLEKKFGDAFLNWAAETPMFFPAKKTQKNKEKVGEFTKRSVFTAMKADSWTWAWLVFYTLLLIFRRHVELPISF